MLPNFSEWLYPKSLSTFYNWVTPFARFELEVCKWLNSQKPFPVKVSLIYVKYFIFSGVCGNLILLSLKKGALSQYNPRRCLTLADFKIEYDLPGEVTDMQISELYQYFDEASWLFIESKGRGSKSKYWFSRKPGIHKIKKFNIISCTVVFMWRH